MVPDAIQTGREADPGSLLGHFLRGHAFHHHVYRPGGAVAFARQVAADLHLTDVQMGLVFSAFAAAYALFEIPSGFLGDKLGPRRVLMRIVIWWSAFTALTGHDVEFRFALY